MHRSVWIFICGVFLSLSSASHAASLVGTSCPDSVGATRMDTDNINIIACVCGTIQNCDTTGHKSDLVWKAMSKTNTPNIICPSGKAVQAISNGTVTCVTPTPSVVTVTKEVYVEPPKPCPGVSKYCVANVGCSGGCFGTFNINLGTGSQGSSTSLGGWCRGPDYSCGGHSCTFDISFWGTASCSSGSWYCTISQKRTSYRDGSVEYSNTSQLYSGACSGL
ncbi:MAG: hypothetical protein WC464_04110 [Bdellovibrionales bacterium]